MLEMTLRQLERNSLILQMQKQGTRARKWIFI